MQAVVLAGGIDIPLFAGYSKPRPFLPIGNKPLIDYTIENLVRHGVDEFFVIVCNGMKEAYEKELTGKGKFTVIEEPYPMGTAGCLALVKDRIDDIFIVTSGSLIINQDIGRVLRSHLMAGASATILVNRIDDLPREGMSLAHDGKVENMFYFHKSHDRRKNILPCGAYLFSPDTLKYLEGGKAYMDIKEQFIAKLRKNDCIVQTFPVDDWSYAREIRNPEDYLDANYDILELGLAGNRKDYARISEGAQVSGTANLIGDVVVGKNASIGDGAVIIGPAVVGNNAAIRNGVYFRESVALDNAVIQDNTKFEYSIVWDKMNSVKCSRRKTVNGNGDGKAKKQPVYSFIKRGMDLFFSFLALMLLSPVFIIVTAAILIETGRPIFYVQRRCGLNGREFPMLKFRTMLINAVTMQKKLLDVNETDGPMFKIENDPRITPIGRMLRRTSLDELPQLLNVLMGDMSLVGPRPLIISEMRYNPKWCDLRLSVKPGITGIWQISARGAQRFYHWITCDTKYVFEQSFLLDVKTLFKTIIKTIYRTGSC